MPDRIAWPSNTRIVHCPTEFQAQMPALCDIRCWIEDKRSHQAAQREFLSRVCPEAVATPFWSIGYPPVRIVTSAWPSGGGREPSNPIWDRSAQPTGHRHLSHPECHTLGVRISRIPRDRRRALNRNTDHQGSPV
jgi:hypothetical protein